MGLDMYLRGEHYNSDRNRHGEISRSKLDNEFEISNYEVDLGYWRKHADLHGYIVNTFAEGKDNCQKIELDENDLDKIIMAIRHDKLVKDHCGFFFGNSTEFGYYEEKEKEYAINCFEKAKKFIRRGKELFERDGLFIQPRSVSYQASW
tara:strand:- start:260 stop:706 length:447 start_codon:yes stop_codon:yes gene_type:complete